MWYYHIPMLYTNNSLQPDILIYSYPLFFCIVNLYLKFKDAVWNFYFYKLYYLSLCILNLLSFILIWGSCILMRWWIYFWNELEIWLSGYLYTQFPFWVKLTWVTPATTFLPRITSQLFPCCSVMSARPHKHVGNACNTFCTIFIARIWCLLLILIIWQINDLRVILCIKTSASRQYRGVIGLDLGL